MGGEMNLKEACLKDAIPRSALFDKIKVLNCGEEIILKPKLGKFSKTFSPVYEELLLYRVKDLTNSCFPLMQIEFLKLTYNSI